MAKVLEFQLQHQSTNEHPGLISFRMDRLDLLEVQGTLKSLLQHHSSKASILLPSAFFIVQLSHLYKTPGKTIALTRWTSVSKVMSLLFNMLCRFVIAFLLRSKLQKSLWAVTAAMKLRCSCLHFTTVTQLYLTLCDPMDCSTPGLLVHHQLPELAQTHVHRVSDAIQPSHPLSSPSSPTFNFSQHQGLFQ